METWKSFAAHSVTHSAAHYLMAIQELRDRSGYARISDVARHLNITKGSASTEIKGLKHRGFVAEDDNRFLLLTDTGARLVKQIVQARRTLQFFLANVLHVQQDQAHIDACKIEHLLSEETTNRMLAMVQYLRSGAPEATAFLKALHQYHFECPSAESCLSLGEDCCLGGERDCGGAHRHDV